MQGKKWCRKHLIEDKVIFVGHLESEEVKQAYVDADVFVLPSYTENFGMTVVEAMACGCPVVISNQVNIWRKVQEAGAGLIVSLDAYALSTAICQVIENADAAQAFGSCGRLAAEKRYAWPRIAQQLSAVYKELIKEKWSTVDYSYDLS